MTPLEQLHADQHEDVQLTSDHQLWAFLAGCEPDRVRLDYAAPFARIEQRMLGNRNIA